MTPNREELFSTYANDELSRAQRGFVEKHVASCLGYRTELASHVQVRRQLRNLSEIHQEVGIMQATTTRIAAQNSGFGTPFGRLVRPAIASIGALVALAAIFVSVQLGGSSQDGFFAKAYAAIE